MRFAFRSQINTKDGCLHSPQPTTYSYSLHSAVTVSQMGLHKNWAHMSVLFYRRTTKEPFCVFVILARWETSMTHFKKVWIIKNIFLRWYVFITIHSWSITIWNNFFVLFFLMNKTSTTFCSSYISCDEWITWKFDICMICFIRPL